MDDFSSKTTNEQLAKEIVDSYKNGTLDLKHAELFNKIVTETASQVTLNAVRDYIQSKKADLNKEIQAEIESAVKKQTEELDKTAKKLHKDAVRINADRLSYVLGRKEDEEYDKRLVNLRLLTVLILCGITLNFVVLFAIFLFITKAVLYDGLWRGFGFNILAKALVNFSGHPIVTFFLYIIYIVVLIGIFVFIFLSSTYVYSKMLYLIQKYIEPLDNKYVVGDKPKTRNFYEFLKELFEKK